VVLDCDRIVVGAGAAVAAAAAADRTTEAAVAATREEEVPPGEVPAAAAVLELEAKAAAVPAHYSFPDCSSAGEVGEEDLGTADSAVEAEAASLVDDN